LASRLRLVDTTDSASAPARAVAAAICSCGRTLRGPAAPTRSVPSRGGRRFSLGDPLWRHPSAFGLAASERCRRARGQADVRSTGSSISSAVNHPALNRAPPSSSEEGKKNTKPSLRRAFAKPNPELDEAPQVFSPLSLGAAVSFSSPLPWGEGGRRSLPGEGSVRFEPDLQSRRSAPVPCVRTLQDPAAPTHSGSAGGEHRSS
jgi:hypothetical protein